MDHGHGKAGICAKSQPEVKQFWAQTSELLLWSFLLRTIQTRLYIHRCTQKYCLFNRRSCRFFFPWPEQPDQQFDETVQRVALRRRYALAFSPGTVNCLLFDPEFGADEARQYVTKYAAKADPFDFMKVRIGDGAAES